MSDIRSFFGKKVDKKQELKSANTKKDVKDSRKKKRMVIESDSDDEDPLPTNLRKEKERKNKIEDEKDDLVCLTPAKPIPKKQRSSEKKKKSEELKQTTTTSFFATPANAKSTKKRKKPEEVSKDLDENLFTDEIQILESPASEKPPSKKAKIEEEVESSTKENKPSSLSSNLAGKKKSASSKLSEENVTSPAKPEDKMKEALSKYINTAEAKKTEKHKELPKLTSPKHKEAKVTSPTKRKAPLSMATTTTPKSKEAKKSSVSTPQQRNASLNESDIVDSTPVAGEKKKKKSFYSYKFREGPTALGSKEIPKGDENCLAGLTFVITGVLESFERDDVADNIKRYGGKVTANISGKTSYILLGRDPGESKLEKAVKHGTKQLTEDDFIELIKARSKKKSSPVKSPVASSKTLKKSHIVVKDSDSDISDFSQETNKNKQSETQSQKSLSSQRQTERSQTSQSQNLTQSTQNSQCFYNQSQPSERSQSSQSQCSQKTQSPCVSSQKEGSAADSVLWVDKYKPKGMKGIVGQQGGKSNANKLHKWLVNWKQNNSQTTDKKKNFYSGKEDGSIFKCALLSGPPGVGKTTSANLVCKEAGFSFIEMNASDTRGKKALETVIKDSLSNTTVNKMMLPNSTAESEKHVLIMDEVDGMAGNEDRGGMQELIQLIKKTKIPIICMCNDRNHPKVRSLANYCFDLRYYKPRVEQIKGFAMSVAAREGLKIQPQAMEQIVVGANQDIRQVLHNLQMWSSTSQTLSYDEAKSNAQDASKNIKQGPFDIVKKLYTHSDCSKMSIKDKTDLFFMDYSFIPLFMQETYLSVNPALAKGDNQTTLHLISETADSFADSDLVDRLIRSEQSWSLLPLQGLYSTVIPSMKMAGYLGGRIDFPRWLGKNSSANKHHRILQELKTHMSMTCRCVKSDINTDYLPMLKDRLTKPLLDTKLESSEAARHVINTMNDYNLLREDWDSILEISKWGNQPDIATKISSKVKSAFTRLYNKDDHKIPYAIQQSAKKQKATDLQIASPDDPDDVNHDEDDVNDESDVSKDAMIKVKKEPAAGSSKGKGKKTTGASAAAKKKAPAKGKTKKTK